MRLIDADVLNGIMYRKAFVEDSDLQRWDGGNWIRYKIFERALKEAPTVEAEPVRSGRWVFDDAPVFGNPYGSFSCSICENCEPHRTPYCSNCGAKMENWDE